MNEPVNIVVGDLSDMGAGAAEAFGAAIADSFLEAAVNAGKRRLEINRADYDTGDPTTRCLLDLGYMRIIEYTKSVVDFEITKKGMARGAEVIAAKAAQP
jgi:hypothetical protein